MSKGTTNRNVRMEDELWLSLKEAAERRGETASDVLRRKAQEYVREPESRPREAE